MNNVVIIAQRPYNDQVLYLKEDGEWTADKSQAAEIERKAGDLILRIVVANDSSVKNVSLFPAGE